MLGDIENIENAYNTLKRLHNSSNVANIDLMKIISELENENIFLKKQLSNAEINLNIQKNVVVNSLLSSQEKHDRDYLEILNLKNEIKLLKNNK